VQYLSTARNVLQSNGYSTDALIFGPHFNGSIPGPQTVWPPGYPSLIALSRLFVPDLGVAALSVNLVAYFLSAVFLWLILRRCGVSRLFAVATTSVFYFSAFQWVMLESLMAEPVSTALILASLWVLPDIRKRSYGRSFMCGVLLATTLLSRHSAVLFIAGVGLALAVVVFRNRKIIGDTSALIFNWILVIVPSMVTFAAINIRIRVLTENAITVAGSDQPLGLIQLLRFYYWEIGYFFGFFTDDPALLRLEPLLTIAYLAFLFLTVLFVGFLLLGLLASYRNPGDLVRSSDTQSCYRKDLSYILIAHTVVFFTYFVFCGFTDVPLNFNRRYFIQVYAGLLILVALLYWQYLSRTSDRHLFFRRERLWINGLCGVLLTLFFLSQPHGYFGGDWGHRRNGTLQALLDYNPQNNYSLRDIIDGCFATSSTPGEIADEVQREKGVLWSTEGQMLHLSFGVPTISLATARAKEIPIDPEEFKQQMDDYNVRLLLLLNKWSDESVWKLDQIRDWVKSEGIQMQTFTGAPPESLSVDVVYLDEGCRLN